ncbi:hypothetical protein LR48_Vigan03g067900 [Vigna angularis]|uniref:Uncharacterized protein n=1 Tax=Phaseolus angularis TaxID=3914 RepID=A0A0L9U399_PHAAN|nr:hypothetical protein LR48_Vigan03g067900 [Vigna angularis]
MVVAMEVARDGCHGYLQARLHGGMMTLDKREKKRKKGAHEKPSSGIITQNHHRHWHRQEEVTGYTASSNSSHRNSSSLLCGGGSGVAKVVLVGDGDRVGGRGGRIRDEDGGKPSLRIAGFRRERSGDGGVLVDGGSGGARGRRRGQGAFCLR